MISTLEIFSKLLQEYKEKDGAKNLLSQIIDLDEYDHFVKERYDIKAIIARLFWIDSFRNKPIYAGLKLQAALDKSFHDPEMGYFMKSLFLGETFEKDLPSISLEEPTGDHFENEKFGVWTADGRPADQCVYCDAKFSDKEEKRNHLKRAFGKHFYNGQRAVQHAIITLGVGTDEKELFKEAKKYLYKKYGEDNGALHTKRCKECLLMFIRKFKLLL